MRLHALMVLLLACGQSLVRADTTFYIDARNYNPWWAPYLVSLPLPAGVYRFSYAADCAWSRWNGSDFWDLWPNGSNNPNAWETDIWISSSFWTTGLGDASCYWDCSTASQWQTQSVTETLPQDDTVVFQLPPDDPSNDNRGGIWVRVEYVGPPPPVPVTISAQNLPNPDVPAAAIWFKASDAVQQIIDTAP